MFLTEYLRRKMALSQEEIAEICGVRQATISRWEAGRGEPDRVQLHRLRKAMHKRGIEFNNEWFLHPDVTKQMREEIE